MAADVFDWNDGEYKYSHHSRYGACLQYHHNVIFWPEFPGHIQSIFYHLTRCAWKLRNDALWDPHEHDMTSKTITCTVSRAIVYVGCLSIWTIGTTDIMMISTYNYRSLSNTTIGWYLLYNRKVLYATLSFSKTVYNKLKFLWSGWWQICYIPLS